MMKVELINYMHSSNGISLQLMPETDVEEKLLKGMFNHGELRTGHPCEAIGNTGYYITAFKAKDNETK